MIYFLGVFQKFGTFCLKNRAYSKLHLNNSGEYLCGKVSWKLCVSIGIGLTKRDATIEIETGARRGEGAFALVIMAQ